ncbi:MAG: site-specific DNA-methyltransferase [Planctomycetes bacterium]|nr:site-specific DNA-methyltransferase [Planctomycetota bacterium]
MAKRSAPTGPKASKSPGRPRKNPDLHAPMEGSTAVRNGVRVKVKDEAARAESTAPVIRFDDKGHPIPSHELSNPAARIYVGDCRELIPRIPECKRGEVDLVFADPPFNWKRGYDKWDDNMAEREYLDFTYSWLDLCIGALRPGGSLWVNIPDDWAAEIVVHLKQRRLTMLNWCIWHYRFGQNNNDYFISSKVHVLYFLKPGGQRTWNPQAVLEMSDRASTYGDARTMSKRDGMPAGMRVPLDVWYGQYLGRVQGNNSERRNYHDNQLPEAYLNRVVRCSSNEGDLVMDPFLGSGTTGVMSHSLKRRFIGTEFSEVNAKNAAARIAAGPVRSYDGPTSSAIFEPRGGKRAATARTQQKAGLPARGD